MPRGLGRYRMSASATSCVNGDVETLIDSALAHGGKRLTPDRSDAQGNDSGLQVAQPDSVAFGDLYELHRDAVFRFVRRLAANDEVAAELTAVAFARAFQAFPSFDPRSGRFLQWVIRIARSAAVDAHRRGRPWLYLSALLPTAHPLASDDPEREVVERERRDTLAHALARLPLPQREAIALRYGAGLTAREIGEVVGKKEEATQKLLRRALSRLKEDLDAL